MPGIAGIISKNSAQDLQRNHEAVRQMVQKMNHESYYRAGTHVEAGLNLAVGWATFEHRSWNCLPIWNETRDVLLIFIGEDHAEAETSQLLKARGHVFEPGNVSYLVHAYEEFGTDFLTGIDGWFSGVLLDLRKRQAILFNDRYGINRLYFHENANGFYFASEAKALLKVLPEVRSLNEDSLAEFFSCGCTLRNQTFFKGVSLVPGGSAWIFHPDGKMEKNCYFKKESWEQLPTLSRGDYYEKLSATWKKIIPAYFRGDQSIGLSLTGGLDSRLIIAHAAQKSGTLPCYTFGGPYRDCADVTISREVARICGQPHETIPLSREYFADFPALMERTAYLTDGTLDSTGTADLFVQKRAREIGPVRITGLNGGELLRRALMFKPTPPDSSLLTPEFAQKVQASATTYAQELNGHHRLSFIMFKQAPWHLHARLSLERTQLTVRTPYFANELTALAYQAPSESINADPALQLIAEGTPELQQLGTDRARKLNAVPGLTRAKQMFQEFTFKAEYAYDYGMPQWLATTNYILSPLRLERLFLGRHKFYHFRVWFRDEFSSYIQDTLLTAKARSRSYLNGAELERMVKAHVAGRANYTFEIRRALAAELLHQQLLEQQ